MYGADVEDVVQRRGAPEHHLTNGQATEGADLPEDRRILLRGDGCIACPNYGTTCDGLEHEWWTDLEWEEMWERGDSD